MFVVAMETAQTPHTIPTPPNRGIGIEWELLAPGRSSRPTPECEGSHGVSHNRSDQSGAEENPQRFSTRIHHATRVEGELESNAAAVKELDRD